MKLIRTDATADTRGRDNRIDIYALFGVPAPKTVAIDQIDRRFTPPSAETVARWLEWSAPTNGSDSDAGSLGEAD